MWLLLAELRPADLTPLLSHHHHHHQQQQQQQVPVG
jgi:hypothetical protein